MDMLKIKQFLNNDHTLFNVYSYGCGSDFGNGVKKGRGDGRGYYGNGDDGNGNCDGGGFANGEGFGWWGSGYGYGLTNGDGNGNGYSRVYSHQFGIKQINGMDVYMVDSIPTMFTNIHENIAKGYIFNPITILKPCYIVKGNGYFAHGKTLKEAQEVLERKIIHSISTNETIKFFREQFPEIEKPYSVKDFYCWHHNLTGSSKMGRKFFATSHNIDIENDVMTVKNFISLAENAYCGEIIRRLKESYGI